MKKCLYLILLCVLLVCISSCGINRIYTSGTYGTIKSYTAKPTYQGKDTTAVYLSADVNKSESLHPDEFNDSKYLIAVNGHRVISWKKFTAFYGLGATYGNYKFEQDYLNVVSAGETADFYNINSKLGIDFRVPYKYMEARYLGVEFNYSYEFGPYLDKLATFPEMDEVVIGNTHSILSYHINTEYIFKLNVNNEIGIGAFSGVVLLVDDAKQDLLSTYEPFFSGAFLHFRHKKYTLSYLREGNNPIRSTKIGFTYHL